MQSVRRTVGMLGLAAVLAGSASAQETRGIVIQGNAGIHHGLLTLDRNGTYNTDTGLTFGGALGYQITQNLVFRADVNYASTPINFNGAPLGSDLTRLYAAGVAQIQFPGHSVNPYFLVGAGAVFLNQHATAEPKQTKGAGLVGSGLGFGLGGGLSLFGETRVYVYQARGFVGNALTDPRVQLDWTFGGGLSYAFGSK